MKQLFFTFMVFILPFVVVSCNENSTNQIKKETDLKQIIKSNNAYSANKWISLEELEIKIKKSHRKVI